MMVITMAGDFICKQNIKFYQKLATIYKCMCPYMCIHTQAQLSQIQAYKSILTPMYRPLSAGTWLFNETLLRGPVTFGSPAPIRNRTTADITLRIWPGLALVKHLHI